MQLQTEAPKMGANGQSGRPPSPALEPEEHVRGFALEEAITFPTVILPRTVDSANQKIAQLLERAAEGAQPRGFKKWFRCLFPPLRSHDKLLREALNVLAKTNTRLANRVNHLIACIDCQTSMISKITEARNADAQTIASFVALFRAFKTDMLSQVASLRHRSETFTEQLVDCQNELSEAVASREKIVSSLTHLAERISDIDQELTQLHATTRLHKDQLNDRTSLLAEQIRSCENNLRESLTSLQKTDETIALTQSGAENRARDIAVHLAQLQAQADRLQVQVAGIDAKMRSDADLLDNVVQEKDLEAATIEDIQRRLDKLGAHLLRVEFDSRIPVTRR